MGSDFTLASPLKREQQPLIGFLQGGKCNISDVSPRARNIVGPSSNY